MFNDQKEVMGVIEHVRDITERKRLEREILEISEQERRRIGQDLHDGLIQHLNGIEFLSQVLEKDLSSKFPEKAAEAKEITSLIEKAITQTQSLAKVLYPVEITTGGLKAILKELA